MSGLTGLYQFYNRLPTKFRKNPNYSQSFVERNNFQVVQAFMLDLIRSQKSEARSQEPEVRSQKT